MSRFIPFTVHVRVVPRRGKRFETIRDLQKLAVLAYDNLSNITGIQVATPGGGQAAQFSDIKRRGGLGSYAQGTAVKPQIGESPAQLMLTGFYEVSSNNTQPWDDQQRIMSNTVYTGPGEHDQDAVPTTAFIANVKALRTSLDSALTTAIPEGVVWNIFRLDFGGVVYGDRGFHFPR